MTLDLNSYLLKYFRPDGTITGTTPVLMIVLNTMIAIPALNGSRSDWSCDPPSGNMAMHPPPFKTYCTSPNTSDWSTFGKILNWYWISQSGFYAPGDFNFILVSLIISIISWSSTLACSPFVWILIESPTLNSFVNWVSLPLIVRLSSNLMVPFPSLAKS